jgi:hypothetical protein
MFVDIHHIVCDGVSLNILMNDFKNAYTGTRLPPLSLRYVDYADWQKQRDGSLQGQEAFWEQLLRGSLPGIGLPVLGDRETADIYPAARKILTIDSDRYQKINQLTAASQVSDFIFLLSIYYLLIAKVSGRTDIIIGTDAMGRTEPSLAGIVGTFVNVLPLRLQVPRKDTYAGFLVRVRDRVLDALERQDVPFDRIGMEAEIVPGHKLVEVYFSYRRLMESLIDLSELEFVPLAMGLRPATTRYELELDAEPDGDRLQLTFLYSTGLYDERTIDSFIMYYNNLLTDVLDDPALSLETIL